MQTVFAKMFSVAEQHPHLLKYILIGAAASAIDLVLFLALYNAFGVSAFAAHAVSVPSAIVFSYTLNARHNFKTTDHGMLRFAAFIAVCGCGFLVGYAIIAAIGATPLGANLGKLLSLPVVFVLQYILNRSITFRPAVAA